MARTTSRFSRRLDELGFPSYDAYLRSELWTTTRRRYLDSGRAWVCACCAGQPLDLHHVTYERLGGERLNDLRPVCRVCHDEIHRLIAEGICALGEAHQRVRDGRTAPSAVTKRRDSRTKSVRPAGGDDVRFALAHRAPHEPRRPLLGALPRRCVGRAQTEALLVGALRELAAVSRTPKSVERAARLARLRRTIEHLRADAGVRDDAALAELIGARMR